MKKAFILILFAAALLCLSACAAPKMPAAVEVTAGAGETAAAPSTDAAVDFSVRDEVYTDTSHANSQISITYPVFAAEGMQEINADILDFVTGFAEAYYGETFSDLQLELTYEIKRYDTEYLSIAFTGTGSVRTAAYPTSLFQTRTYDLQSGWAVKLSMLHPVDEAFAETLYAAVQESVSSEIWEVFQADYPNADALLSALQSCDADSWSCQSYVTPQTVGVSIPVRHVGGDHIEAEIAL